MSIKIVFLYFLWIISGIGFSQNLNEGYEPLLEIGCSDTDPYIFGWINTVQLDNRGFIYTFDAQRDQHISVFDTNGNKVDSIGNSGRGPGEFTGLKNFHLDSNNEILTVLDFRQSKISTFSISKDNFGMLINELFFERYKSPTPQNIRPIGIFKISNGDFLLQYEGLVSPQTVDYPAKQRIINMDPDTIEQTEIVTLREDEVNLEVNGNSIEVFKWPHSGKNVLAVNSSGKIFKGWSYDDRIKLYDKTGMKTGEINLALSPMPMSSKDKSYVLRDYPQKHFLFRRKVRNMLNDYWPFFEQLVIDDNDILWVGIFSEDLSTEWRGFTLSGEKVAGFSLPNRDEIKSMNGNYMAAVRSVELGAECIIIYKK